MIEPGMLITFEGGEGSGKSTQIKRLAARLQAAGLGVQVFREPGGTVIGEAIRNVLLSSEHQMMEPRAELLLYEAARAQLVTEVVQPAIAAGDIVLLDRFYDSTTAYQGYGRGILLSEVVAMNAIGSCGLVPDRTILLDLGVTEGLGRAKAVGAADRLELEDVTFHERVRAGFLAIAASETRRVFVVDASGSEDDVAAKVEAALRGLYRVSEALGIV